MQVKARPLHASRSLINKISDKIENSKKQDDLHGYLDLIGDIVKEGFASNNFNNKLIKNINGNVSVSSRKNKSKKKSFIKFGNKESFLKEKFLPYSIPLQPIEMLN